MPPTATALPQQYYLRRKCVAEAVGGVRALARAERLGAIVPVRGILGLKQARYERPRILRYLDCLNGLVDLATVVRENAAGRAPAQPT
jgi:hypothetical protein